MRDDERAERAGKVITHVWNHGGERLRQKREKRKDERNEMMALILHLSLLHPILMLLVLLLDCSFPSFGRIARSNATQRAKTSHAMAAITLELYMPDDGSDKRAVCHRTRAVSGLEHTFKSAGLQNFIR